MTSRAFLGLAILFVVLLDRLTKILIIHRVSEGEGFPVLAGVFHITRAHNTGAAFGLLQNSPAVLVAVSTLLILLIMYGLVRSGRRRSGLASYGWAVVMAGAAGNLYDRLRYGYVIDFLDLRVWPVFNVADMGICIGVFLVLAHFFSREDRKGS